MYEIDLDSLREGKTELNISRFIGTVERGNQDIFVGFGGIADIVGFTVFSFLGRKQNIAVLGDQPVFLREDFLCINFG